MSSPALLEILGWRVSGLRVPDHDLDFRSSETSEVYGASIIQMPNGTGKTTTLRLLRAALSGSADRWDEAYIQSFKKKGHTSEDGVFRLDTRVKGNLWTIELRFDFELGKVSYYSTLKSGQRPGFHPPMALTSVARPGLVDFFVFDGELAEGLLDPQARNAGYAIDQFFRLDLLERASGEILKHWDRVTKDRTATEEKGLRGRANKLAVLVGLLKQRKDEAQALASSITSKEKELAGLEAKFRDSIDASEARRERHSKLQRREQRLTLRRDEELSNAVSLFRSPLNVAPVFAIEVERFKDRLDRVKLPESAAREFFEELADEVVCICGRKLDDATRTEIRERASSYLGSDNIALLNSLKADVVDGLQRAEGSPWMLLERCLDELQGLGSNLREVDTQLQALRLEAAQESPEQEGALETIKGLAADIRMLRRKMDDYEASYEKNSKDPDVRSVAELERRHRKAEGALAEIADTFRLRDQRDRLVRILEIALETARADLCQELVRRTNLNIEKLLPYNDISVRGIERALLLEGQDAGSVGETLSVAYSFLSTLFEHAVSRLPLVVDSPAGPIDLRVRPQVAALVPRLTGQFIAFTISTERQGFVEPLAYELSGDLQYLTLFRKGDPELEASAHGHACASETEDGVLVEDRDFFDGFHRDEEA
jgi:DNA sulfur modification protein DndD